MTGVKLLDDPEEWKVTLVTKGSLVFAAIVGAMFRAMTRPDLSWPMRLISSFAAVVFAYMLTPIAAPIAVAGVYKFASWLSVDLPPGSVDPVSMIGVTGLMLGLVGAPVMEGILKAARNWRDDPRIPRL